MGSIRDEIKQKRPFASAADEALVTLLRTTDHLRAALSAVVEPRGITMQQYNVLRILRGAGERGLPTLEIGERMIERSPGVTRLLERLEAKQLVRRRRCREDLRQVLCSATAEALALLDALEGPLAQESQRLLSVLDSRRTAELVRSLDTIREGPPRPADVEPSAARRSRKKNQKEKRKP
jgi:DNA-binding MarR family transcriptional regulator